MHPMSWPESVEHHKLAGDYPQYWPKGFLPSSWDGAGSYVVVNCIATSPTYFAVYEMCDGVGCTRIASSLSEFFAASTQEVLQGLRNYSEADAPSLPTRQSRKGQRRFRPQPLLRPPTHGSTRCRLGRRLGPSALRASNYSSPAPPASPEIVRWARVAGVRPPAEDGSYEIKLSTAPVEQWFFKKSSLAPGTTNIEASIRDTSWTVNLNRQDGLYSVMWSSGGTISVRSDQLKYKRLIRWPAIDAIENFPALVKQIETLLGLKFIPYANVTLPYTETRATLASPDLLAWLAPCANKVGCYIGGERNTSF